jgi:hypothetical protein
LPVGPSTAAAREKAGHYYSQVTFEGDTGVKFRSLGGGQIDGATLTLPRRPISRVPVNQFNSLRRPAPIGRSVRGMTAMYEALRGQVMVVIVRSVYLIVFLNVCLCVVFNFRT